LGLIIFFELAVRFFDAKMLPQITWTSEETINTPAYHAKPTIFLKSDDYPMAKIKEFPVYANATLLARELNGCLNGFDKILIVGK
jgi:hypothetical protein